MSKGKRNRRLLLKNVADALQACEKHGITVKLEHGVVFSRYGYVLPIKDRWVVRTLKQLDK